MLDFASSEDLDLVEDDPAATEVSACSLCATSVDASVHASAQVPDFFLNTRRSRLRIV